MKKAPSDFVRIEASRGALITMVDLLCSIIETRVLPAVNSPLHHSARWLVDDSGWRPKRVRSRLAYRKPRKVTKPRT